MKENGIISQSKLFDACTRAGSVANLRFFESIESTNSWALEQSEHGCLCVAGRQTAGRGRRSSRWQSQQGDVVLSYSVVDTMLPPGFFALNVGIVIIESLRKMGGCGLKIKWPNDLVYEHQQNLVKIGGILIESQGLNERFVWVTGVGLNVATRPGLRQIGVDAPLEEIIAGVALAVENIPLSFNTADFDEHNVLKNRRISFVDRQHNEQTGKAISVDADGALMVLTGQGLSSFSHIHSVRLI